MCIARAARLNANQSRLPSHVIADATMDGTRLLPGWKAMILLARLGGEGRLTRLGTRCRGRTATSFASLELGKAELVRGTRYEDCEAILLQL